MTARQATVLILSMSFSFLLGWESRGDMIYSGMFNKMSYAASDLPMSIKEK